MKVKQFTCCFCNKTFKGIGNNPAGAMWRDRETNELIGFEPKPGDRCCDECDAAYVIPGRIFRVRRGIW